MRVNTAVAMLLWSAAVLAADDVPRNLQLMDGGVAFRIGDRSITAAGLEAALAQAEASEGESPRVAALLNILGDRQRSESRFSEAAGLYQRALTIFQKSMGARHPNVATVSLNLGASYQAQNRSGDAVPHYERALAIFEQALSPEHSYVTVLRRSIVSMAAAPTSSDSTKGRWPNRRRCWDPGIRGFWRCCTNWRGCTSNNAASLWPSPM